MKFKDLSKEELSLLSYTDLTNMIIKENKKSMKTAEIFKKICDALGYNEEVYAEKIGDYYTSLMTDKRFVLLEDTTWDLKDNHVIPLELDDEDEIEEVNDSDEEDEDEAEDSEEDIDTVISDDDMEDIEDDIEDLSIVDENELEES